MKNAFLMLLVILFASASFASADDTSCAAANRRVITAPNVDNQVATTLSPSPIHSGTLPWTTKGAAATVKPLDRRCELRRRRTRIEWRGLQRTLPSGFPKIVGTLVCNAGNTGRHACARNCRHATDLNQQAGRC